MIDNTLKPVQTYNTMMKFMLEHTDISDEYVAEVPRRVHDYRNYLDSHIVGAWPYLSDETKRAYAYMAECQAHNEEWN